MGGGVSVIVGAAVAAGVRVARGGGVRTVGVGEAVSTAEAQAVRAISIKGNTSVFRMTGLYFKRDTSCVMRNQSIG